MIAQRLPFCAGGDLGGYLIPSNCRDKTRNIQTRRAKLKTKAELEQNGQTRRYTDDDRFGLLIQKGGGMSLVEYLKLPNQTKKKVHTIYRGIRVLPDQFLTSEVQDIITRDLGMVDYQRLLMMLFQGGYLTREKDFGHRIMHTKTELAKALDDRQLAADIMSKADAMIGCVASTRITKRRKEKPPEPKSHLRVVNADLKNLKEVGAKPAVGEHVEAQPSQAKEKAPNKNAKGAAVYSDLQDMLRQLDEPDRLMIMDLVVSLKAARQFFPKLSRKQFLQTFVEGGRYVEE